MCNQKVGFQLGAINITRPKIIFIQYGIQNSFSTKHKQPHAHVTYRLFLEDGISLNYYDV